MTSRLRGVGWRWLLWLVLIVLVSAFTIQVSFTALRTASLEYQLSGGHIPFPVRAYRRFFRQRISPHDTTITARGEPLLIRVYEPKDLPRAETIVLIHGLSPDGVQLPSINELAKVLAEDGFRVVLPNVNIETKLLMRKDAVYEIGDAVHWAAQQSGRPVAVFGFSFGGGLALAMAEMPEFGHDVKLVLSASGFNSLERIGSFYLHEKPLQPDGKPYDTVPYGGGALLMAYQYLKEITPPGEYQHIQAAAYHDLTFQKDTPEGQQAFAALTPAEQSFYKELRAAESPAIIQAHHRLMAEHDAEFTALSPYGKLGELQCPVYQLHGLRDWSVPEGEAMWTAHELPASNAGQTLITSAMKHASLDKDAPRRERLKSAIFLAELMHKVADSHAESCR